MINSIGISIGTVNVPTNVTPPSGFATTLWELLTITTWENITDTWN
jgi:hypothetical protein